MGWPIELTESDNFALEPTAAAHSICHGCWRSAARWLRRRSVSGGCGSGSRWPGLAVDWDLDRIAHPEKSPDRQVRPGGSRRMRLSAPAKAGPLRCTAHLRPCCGCTVSLSSAQTMNDAYVHGYEPRESVRLQDQAGTLVDLLHSDTSYPAGSHVLEAGCGVGAQTVTLARNSPGARILSVDLSADSIAEARAAGGRRGPHQCAVPASGPLRLAFRPGILRPRLRLFRPGAPFTAGRGSGDTERAAQAGRHDHRHRGGPWVGLLPSRQRRGPQGNPVPGRAAAGGRRQCADWAATLPAAGRGGFRRGPRLSRGWCMWIPAGPISWMASRRKTFTAMIEGVRESAITAGMVEARGLRCGNPGSLPNG